MKEESFSGKVALVTGGGSGIGRASAIEFARRGARVAVVDLDLAAAAATTELITATGGSALPLAADVSLAGDVEALHARVIAHWGRIDFAHNNAGIEGAVANVQDVTEDDWDRTLAVNLKGVWLCLRAQVRAMLAGGGGAIVNTASVAGLVGQPGAGAYCASKHGVIGLTKAVALECAGQGIRVNAICPGLVDTAMAGRLSASKPGLVEALVASLPMGRMARPEEVASVVAWLCSSSASYVTGQALPVDGGVVSR
jgi:NAD(P)-dependent dehydrogenase (short-subunit alcohol dehydrogenase family)